jgi:hypothetical protein
MVEMIVNSKELADLTECQIELILWPHSTLGQTYQHFTDSEVE